MSFISNMAAPMKNQIFSKYFRLCRNIRYLTTRNQVDGHNVHNNCIFKKRKLLTGYKTTLHPCINISNARSIFVGSQFCQQDDRHKPSKLNSRRNLKLMDFKEIIWPSVYKSLRNVLFRFLISGYFDQHFSRDEFLDGAEQAIVHVSNLISIGDFDGLNGLVTDEAIAEIKRNYANLNEDCRALIKVVPGDLFMRFMYEIGVIMNDETEQRFVEITVVLHGLQGWRTWKGENQSPKMTFDLADTENLYVCNYRFRREYTKGVEDDWTISKLNHFTPSGHTHRNPYGPR